MNQPKSAEEWQAIITTARQSGLSDKEWCLQNDVSVHTFYYNVRRLRNLACEVPPSNVRPAAVRQQVVPVQIVDDERFSHSVEKVADNTTVIRINFSGINISVSNGASRELIRSLMDALKGAEC